MGERREKIQGIYYPPEEREVFPISGTRELRRFVGEVGDSWREIGTYPLQPCIKVKYKVPNRSYSSALATVFRGGWVALYWEEFGAGRHLIWKTRRINLRYAKRKEPASSREGDQAVQATQPGRYAQEGAMIGVVLSRGQPLWGIAGGLLGATIDERIERGEWRARRREAPEAPNKITHIEVLVGATPRDILTIKGNFGLLEFFVELWKRNVWGEPKVLRECVEEFTSKFGYIIRR